MNSNAPDKIGHVTEKWWQTKKILDWKYVTPLSVSSALFEKLGDPIATVSLEQGKSDEKGVRFVARSRWFGDKIGGLQDKSLEGLKKQVGEAFRDMILAHTEVAWEDWFEVKIRGARFRWIKGEGTADAVVRFDDEEGHAYLNVEYKRLKRARFPDGRDMVLDGNSLYPFPKAKVAGTSRKFGSRGYHQDDESQYAYIPATPGNLLAVQELMKKLGEVNARLVEVLNQQEIAQTVKLLTGSGQLRLEKK